jgi:hypothetical protein
MKYCGAVIRRRKSDSDLELNLHDHYRSKKMILWKSK